MSDEDTQADLDAAQADLQAKVGQLKELLETKVEAVKRPYEWLTRNYGLILVGIGAGIVLHALLRRDEL